MRPVALIAEGFTRLRDKHWPGTVKPIQLPITLERGAKRFLEMGASVDLVLQHLDHSMAERARTNGDPPYSLEAFHKSLARRIREHDHADAARPGDAPDRQEPGMTSPPKPTNGLSHEDDTRRMYLRAFLDRNVWLPSWKAEPASKDTAQREHDQLIAKGQHRIETERQTSHGGPQA